MSSGLRGFTAMSTGSKLASLLGRSTGPLAPPSLVEMSPSGLPATKKRPCTCATTACTLRPLSLQVRPASVLHTAVESNPASASIPATRI